MNPANVMRQLDDAGRGKAAIYQTPYHWSAGYVLMAVAVAGLGWFGALPGRTTTDVPGPEAF
jgi:hypothetical protein